MKMLISLLAISVLLISTPVFADNNFIKGNDAENPLMTSLYAAKTFEIGEKKEGSLDKAIRIKLERKNNIGKFSEAEYTVSAGLEF